MTGRVTDAAGFVLAGGGSTRMGRDKALLASPHGSGTLLEHAAAAVRTAVGNVTVIGAPERYRHLDLVCVADALPGNGPLGGLATALRLTRSDWNVLVACDMPNINPELLLSLVEAAREFGRDGAVPITPEGPEPLCAVYHRRLASEAEAAINRKSLKMQDFVSTIHVLRWPAPDPGAFANWNTLQELAR